MHADIRLADAARHQSFPNQPFPDQLLPEARILFVSSELAGLVKAGGLGEISAYLPGMLNHIGQDARLLLPGYRSVLERVGALEVMVELPGLNEVPACRLAQLRMQDGLTVYLLICPELYDRPGSPYVSPQGMEFPDSDLRFARLGLAAAQIAAGVAELGWMPDLVHANDWPSALAPAYMKWRGLTTPSILTIHNLAYQGLFDASRIGPLGIPSRAFQPDGVEFYGRLSFMKAGLFYATSVTTVSPTYAREILTPEYGCGLDGLLRQRADRGELTGILNGIDASYDPRSDPHLTHHFNALDLSGKRENAAELRRIFNLKPSAGPLFALVSRLVYQKGVDLVAETADEIVQGGGQVVAIGQGEPKLEEAMSDLAGRHPGMVGATIGFEEALARKMYAGSDFLLMPSRFEPCGLSQMYAQRFGSLPIAHRTGGLADTIQDDVTGFLFDLPSAAAFRRALRRAFGAFSSGAVLQRMKRAAMRRPGGWRDAALRYQGVYRRTREA
jgi:starch synthase